MNEYEIIYLVQEGNEEARKILYDKYKNLLEKNARIFYQNNSNKGIDFKDILLELQIAFEEAVNNYDQDKGAIFSTYLISYINNTLKYWNRTLSRQKNKILSEALSMEDENVNYYSNLQHADLLCDNYVFEEELNIEDMYNNLSDKEKQIIVYLKDNYSYKEIADILNKDVKYVYNIIYRIKNKLRNNV